MRKGLLHIVLAESAAAIFKIKRIIKQFKKACASQIHRKFVAHAFVLGVDTA